MRRDPAARPWPALALVAGAAGSMIAAVVLMIALVTWTPLLSALLFG